MGLVSVAQLPWPHFGRTRTLNAAIYCVPVSSISAGQRGNGQVADRRDTVYGSESWGPRVLPSAPKSMATDCRVDDRSQPYRRDVQLKSLYGITQADYDRLLALQYSRCAICGTTKPGTRGTWRVDHDHQTGQVRGLLCDRCNLGIGYMQDNPDILMAAGRYVMKHRQKEG